MRSRWFGSAAVLVGLVLLSVDRGAAQPPGGFPGGGGGFPGGGGFGGPGGGMRGGFDPESMWQRLSGGADSINLNDPRFAFMKGMMERGGDPLPPNGIVTKQQFMEGMQRRMAARQAGGGMAGQPGGGGPGGPQMMTFQGGPGGFGGGREFGGRDRDRRLGFDGGPGGFAGQPGGFGGPPGGFGYPGGYPGQPGPGGGSDGKDDGKKKEKEVDYTQVGIRYGKLPPGLPDFFTELDADKDGQVGLYEWRAAGRKTDEFTALDADGDGLITPREWLRGEAIKAEVARLTAAGEGGDATPTRSGGGRGAGSDGATPGKGDAKAGDRGRWGGGAGKKDRGKN
jgi:hypothetical protein